jgi:hypothetical protein
MIENLPVIIPTVAAGLALVGWVVRAVVRGVRRIVHVLDDLQGEEARPGVAARPGLMERMEKSEADHAHTQRVLDELVAEVRKTGDDVRSFDARLSNIEQRRTS